MTIGMAARAGMAGLALMACTIQAEELTEARAGSDGFGLSSPDGAWELELRALVQVDGRWFFDDSAPDEDSEWLLRRVRPSLEGRVGERIAFRVMPDFGGGDPQLVDAWIDIELGGGLSLRTGKFKPPVGLERQQSSTSLRLVERSYVSELLPNRDVGVQLSGGDARLSWAAGLFNGVNDGRSGDQDDDGNQEVALRLFSELFGSSDDESVLGVGVGASYGSTDGASDTPLLSGYRSPGQNTVFGYRDEGDGGDGTFADGERLRLSPQFYWYSGPWGLLGEWARVRQDVRRITGGLTRSATLDHDAWQLTGEWLLTGDKTGFRDPGAAGTVQLVARVSRLSIDDDAFAGGTGSFADPASAVRTADTWGAGVNWWPLTGLKASFAYQQTSFEGGAAIGNRLDERVLFVRLQLAF